MNKRQRELERALKPHGYRIEGRNKSGHFVAKNPETGHRITVPFSPRSWARTMKNVLMYIRQSPK